MSYNDIYQCKGCLDWFEPDPSRSNLTCLVTHKKGQCCHYTETCYGPIHPGDSAIPAWATTEQITIPVGSYNNLCFTLSDVEQVSADAFQARHEEKHLKGKPVGYKSHPSYIYRFQQTGIGPNVWIVCDTCHKKKNITDYESW